MTDRLYDPRFKKQLTGTKLARFNCNMAASAVAADRYSLGAINVSADTMRARSGDTEGGTTIEAAATALSSFGITLNVYDATDGATLGNMWDFIDRGHGVIVHGDYDRIPVSLRGDKEFEGLHSVYVQEHDENDKRIKVWDSVDDGRIDQPSGTRAPKGPLWWPTSVLDAYAAAFPTRAIVFGDLPRRMLVARVAVANVRSGPGRSYPVIDQLRDGQRLERGHVKVGERIGGDARWFRVWSTRKGVVGYMHASVVRTLGGI